jgi:hypothetical protein
MKDEVRQALKDYYNVSMMLERIPEELWPIFAPKTIDELSALEQGILSFKSREREREQVITIQRLCGFPLRPNIPLSEVKARARLQGREKDKLRKRRDEDTDSDSVH